MLTFPKLESLQNFANKFAGFSDIHRNSWIREVLSNAAELSWKSYILKNSAEFRRFAEGRSSSTHRVG